MKASIILCLLFVGMYSNSVYSQVFDHNDPIVYYDENNPPSQPANGNVGKWVVTKRVNWNTSNYKSYIFRGMPFRLRYPNNFDPTSDKTYPLIIMWHGRGEAGPIYDNEKNLVHAARDHDNDIDRGYYDGFVMFPQNQSGSWGDVYYNIVHDLITNKISDLKVDPNRIITHGLSSGAYATWKYITSYPKDVAAALPMSGVSITDIPNVNIFKHIPIWLSQGGKDNAPSPYTSGQMVDAFTEVGGNIRYTIFLNGGHGIWNNAYAESDFWPFIMRANKTNPVVLSGAVTLVSQSSSKEVYEFLTNEEICPGDPINVTMGVTPGFSAYEWRKDGVVIPGQTANQLTVTEFGTYDVRFRRGSEWTNWSERAIVVKEKAGTVTPDIQVAGLFSKHKPSPDGIATVPLELPEGYVAYEWRKAGTTQTLSTERIFTVSETGSYVAKVTEQFGCSSDFSNEFQVIDANSANKPAAIDNLAGFTESKTSTKLQWATNLSGPNPATAFEIYRTESSGENYQLAGIVEAASLEFIDTGLNPNTTYYYIVRPINNYSAASVSSEVAVITDVDDLAPTAPLNLAVESSGSNEVSLVWDASTDDVGVFRYDIYRNGVKVKTTEETSTTIYNLQEGESYNFFVKARDYAGNESPFSNQAIGVAISNGVDYKYYLKSWAGNNLPNFNDLTPEYSGNIPNFDISVRSQNSNYGFLFESEINIPVAGSYTFETRSDDGSKLYIGDYNESNLVVNNDGAHGMQYREGTYVFPEAGSYKFYVTFYQGGGGAGLEVYWKNTAHGVGNRQRIPDSAFEKQIPAMGSVPTAPDSIVATAQSYKQILLEWKDMSDNENQFQIFRSEAGGDYLPIAMVSANETTYTDLGLKAATDYAYQVIALNNNGQSQSAVVEVSSLGHLTFEDQITDQSENSISNQMNGTTLYNTDSKEGSKSIEFDGNSYVDLDRDNSFIHSAFTERSIAFWIKALDANGTQDIYDEGGSTNGIGIRLVESDIELTVQNGHDIYPVSSPFARNEWHHVMGVFDNGSLRLFIDGNLVGERSDIAYSEVNDHGDAGGLGGTNGSNAFDVVSDRFHGLMDDFYVFGTALSNPIALMASSDKTNEARTFDAPNPPSAIMNFTAAASSSTSIDVSWDHDNLSDQYTLLQGLGEDVLLPVETYSNTGQESFLYEDVDLLPHTTYYYQVISENDGGIFESEIFSAITGNNIPSVGDIGNLSIRYESDFDLNLTASDEDGDVVIFSTQNLPEFAELTDYNDNTALLRFSPAASDANVYNDVAVIVEDGFGGSDTVRFNLVVNNNHPPVLEEISNISINEGDSLTTNIFVSDVEGVGNLQWSSDLPSFVNLVLEINGDAKLVAKPSYADHGNYASGLKVTDADGATSEIFFNIEVIDQNPNKIVQVNFTDGTLLGGSGWNNTEGHPIIGDTYSSLFDKNGNSTGISLSIMSNWTNSGSNNSGASTGNNSGVYPDNVLRSAYWTYVQPETFSINGLDNSKTYELTFFGSRNATDNRTTNYTVGGQTATLNAASNTTNTVTIGDLNPSDGSISVQVARGAGSTFGYINALVINEIFESSGTPAAPRLLTLDFNESQGEVDMQWSDQAFNESNYRVYKSDDGINFTVLAELPANIEMFSDSDIQPSTSVYYKVSAVNSNGENASEVVSMDIPNIAPYLSQIEDQVIEIDNIYTVSVSATDAVGDVIELNAVGLPSFVSFVDNGDGNGQLTFAPEVGDNGEYEIVVKAMDQDNLESQVSFSVIVNSESIHNYLINFAGVSANNQSGWNNFIGNGTAGQSLTNITALEPQKPSLTIDLLDSWGGYNSLGMTGSSVFPDNVSKSSIWMGDIADKKVLISGLSSDNAYDFEFFGSRNGSGNRTTNYIINGITVSLDAAFNQNETVKIEGIVPNVAGEVIIVVNKAGGASYGYLNALKITGYKASSIPTNPSNLNAAPVNSSSIALNWNDNSADELGFELWRSDDDGNSFDLVQSVGSNVKAVTQTGLLKGITYYYKVRAILEGGEYSEYSNIARSSTINAVVKINFNAADAAASPWNNTNMAPEPGAVFENLINENSQNTGIAFEVVESNPAYEQSLYGFSGDNPIGVITGDNSGVVPDNVMRSSWWMDPGRVAELRFYDLDLSQTYKFAFFASRDGGGNRTSVYSINGEEVKLNASYNVNNIVELANIQPDKNGNIFVKITSDPGASFSYVGAIIVSMSNSVIQSQSERVADALRTFDREGSDEEDKFNNQSDGVFRVYPNPYETGYGPLTLFFDGDTEEKMSLRVIGSSGKVIRTIDSVQFNSSNETNVDMMDELENGIYIIQLVGNSSGIHSYRVLKN